ncbi:serine/threonine-protein kinase [Streptomyces melanogenes]|uniref:serine/threonine-protein kinase n=1 Tax=Streptomyces melanogenes TaxID=67326 RepID=UPI00379CFF3B
MKPLTPTDPQSVGRYMLLGRLGAGGMGLVYLGRSPGGRLVAVKVVHDELASDEDFRARFRQEISAMRRVGGFWTATVVDADPDADVPWLATAYIAGPSLDETVRTCGPLPPDSARVLACGLAEALAAIHEAGLVHRDLKPSNVLLSGDGPRVIDFGIARAMADRGLTGTGHVIGTPGFISPEQAQGKRVGPASDIFCVGLVLTYCTTGGGAYGTGDSLQLMYRVVHESPDLHAVPAELRGVVTRCLVRDPEQRPDAASLLELLGRPEGPTADSLGGWLPDQATVLARRYEHEARQAGAAPPAPSVHEPAGQTAVWARSTAVTTSTDPTPAAAGAGYEFRDNVWQRSLVTVGVLVGLGVALALSFPSSVVATLLVGVIAVLAVSKLAALVFARRDRIRIGPSGIEARARGFRAALPWNLVEQVAVVRVHSRLFVVAWPATGAMMPAGVRRRSHFGGGFRVFTFPIANATRRETHLLEVTTALRRFSGGRYQP